MTAPITTEEIGRWISDDRNHGVNVNSGVLSDMCREIIRNRAKLEAAAKLAEALDLVSKRCGPRATDGHVAAAAISAWEALK